MRHLILLTTAVLTLLCLISLLSGCAHNENKNFYGELLYTSTAYYNGLRWQQFDLSASALPPDQRESFIRKRESQRDRFRVVDYEVRNRNYDATALTAVLQVDYRWYRTNDPTVRTTRMRQQWQYDKNRGAWELSEQGEEEIPEELPPGASSDLL